MKFIGKYNIIYDILSIERAKNLLNLQSSD